MLGFDLPAICFDGPEAELTRTENAQPAIFLTSWVALQLLEERVPDFAFQAAAGLSLGELTALAAAGVFTFRGRLANRAPTGPFHAGGVRADSRRAWPRCLAWTAEVCAPFAPQADVEMANLNCPGQIVISGETDKDRQSVRTGQSQRRQTRGAAAGGGRLPFASHGQRPTQSRGHAGRRRR